MEGEGSCMLHSIRYSVIRKNGKANKEPLVFYVVEQNAVTGYWSLVIGQRQIDRALAKRPSCIRFQTNHGRGRRRARDCFTDRHRFYLS